MAVLRNSHVISEFFYLPFYDQNNHKYSVVKLNTPSLNSYPVQKGVREYLLCHECEQQLGQYEDYVRNLLYDASGGLRITSFPHTVGVDYAKVRLFQLSILWRASISNREFFANIKLAHVDEERLRDMIHQKNPGSWDDFGCYVIGDVKGRAKEFMEQPGKLNIPWIQTDSYSFMMAGMMWIFFKEAAHLPPEVSPYIVREDGTMNLGAFDFEQAGLIDSWVGPRLA
jgi:hypothetical protein